MSQAFTYDKPYTKLIIHNIKLTFNLEKSSDDRKQKAGWLFEKGVKFEHLSDELQEAIKAELSEGLLPLFQKEEETLEEVIYEN